MKLSLPSQSIVAHRAQPRSFPIECGRPSGGLRRGCVPVPLVLVDELPNAGDRLAGGLVEIINGGPRGAGRIRQRRTFARLRHRNAIGAGLLALCPLAVSASRPIRPEYVSRSSRHLGRCPPPFSAPPVLRCIDCPSCAIESGTMGIFSRVTLGSGTGRATPCLAPNPGVFSRRTGGRPVRSARAPPTRPQGLADPAPPRWSTQTVPPPARRSRHCRRRNSRLPLHRAPVLPTAPLRFARPARRKRSAHVERNERVLPIGNHLPPIRLDGDPLRVGRRNLLRGPAANLTRAQKTRSDPVNCE